MATRIPRWAPAGATIVGLLFTGCVVLWAMHGPGPADSPGSPVQQWLDALREWLSPSPPFICGGDLPVSALDDIPRVRVQFDPSQRFGILGTRRGDPRSPDSFQRLTHHERGSTNSTCIRLDGTAHLFGDEASGHWVTAEGQTMKEVSIPGKDKDRAWQSVWEIEATPIRVTQSVEIVIGEQARLYDTVLVKYQLWNHDQAPHTIGLRVLLHPCSGSQTGVRYYVPPTAQAPERMGDAQEVFATTDVPDFIRFLQSDDGNDPTTPASVLGLKFKQVEPLQKLIICRWPGDRGMGWDWEYQPIDDPAIPSAGACIVLFWAEALMAPQERRDLVFTFGWGRIGD